MITPKAFNKNLWPNTPLRIKLDGIIENSDDEEHAHGMYYAMLDSESNLEGYLTAKTFLFNEDRNVIYDDRDNAVGCESTEFVSRGEVDRIKTDDIVVPIKHRAAEPVKVGKNSIPSWRGSQKLPKKVVLKSARLKNDDFSAFDGGIVHHDQNGHDDDHFTTNQGDFNNFGDSHQQQYFCPMNFGEKPLSGPTEVIYKPSIFKKSTSHGHYDLNEVLHKSLLFFESQRSGKLTSKDKKTIPWRGDSNLRDGCDVNQDLSGGWYFAGDHIKYTYQMAFSVTLMAYGMIDYRKFKMKISSKN